MHCLSQHQRQELHHRETAEYYWLLCDMDNNEGAKQWKLKWEECLRQDIILRGQERMEA